MRSSLWSWVWWMALLMICMALSWSADRQTTHDYWGSGRDQLICHNTWSWWQWHTRAAAVPLKPQFPVPFLCAAWEHFTLLPSLGNFSRYFIGQGFTANQREYICRFHSFDLIGRDYRCNPGWNYVIVGLVLTSNFVCNHT